jgi:hypothetical protein
MLEGLNVPSGNMKTVVEVICEAAGANNIKADMIVKRKTVKQAFCLNNFFTILVNVLWRI